MLAGLLFACIPRHTRPIGCVNLVCAGLALCRLPPGSCAHAFKFAIESTSIEICWQKFPQKIGKFRTLEYVIGPEPVTAEKILGSVAQTFTKLCPLSELAAAYHGLVCPFHRVRVSDAQLVCCNRVMLPTWS